MLSQNELGKPPTPIQPLLKHLLACLCASIHPVYVGPATLAEAKGLMQPGNEQMVLRKTLFFFCSPSSFKACVALTLT